MGKCVLQSKGTKVPFAAVSERYVVCEWLDVCLCACLCMCDCACVLFIHVAKDWICKLLFITLECDVMSSHTRGRGRWVSCNRCSSCLKLCTKLSDQTSCFDLKKVHCFLVTPPPCPLPFDETTPFDGPFDVNRCFVGQNLRTNFKLKTFHFCNLF